MHCVSCSHSFAHESYIHTSTTQLTVGLLTQLFLFADCNNRVRIDSYCSSSFLMSTVCLNNCEGARAWCHVHRTNLILVYYVYLSRALLTFGVKTRRQPQRCLFDVRPHWLLQPIMACSYSGCNKAQSSKATTKWCHLRVGIRLADHVHSTQFDHDDLT